MFWQIYFSRIKRSIHTKDILFWTLLFPIFLSTMFKLALSSLDDEFVFSPIPVALVEIEGTNGQKSFNTVVEGLAKEGEGQLLNLTIIATQQEADELLEEEEIDGYFLYEDQPKLIVKNSSFSQTILKNFLDQYLQIIDSMERTADVQQELLTEDFFERLTDMEKEYSMERIIGIESPSNVFYYYLALLGMLCMYGSFQGLESVVSIQANLSANGARLTASPTRKWKLVLADMLGGYTSHIFCVFIALFYMIFVLGIDFGSRFIHVLSVCLLGSIVGVAFGAAISCTSNLKYSVKSGIMVVTSLIFSFLSGLMISGINYLIAKNLPVLAWINPVNRIADAFYALYYYETYEFFWMNMAVLASMALLLICFTSIFVRRKSYDYI